ncbi:MAG: 4Fe-4S binding protein [Planctomycetota bacterium]
MKRAVRVALLRLYRAGVLVGLFAGIQMILAAEASRSDRPITLREVQRHLPDAVRITTSAGDSRMRLLVSESGRQIGSALRTSPRADDIIGYTGPSDVLIVLDESERVVAAELRSSGDTEGHVASVIADEAFWAQWPGRNAEDIAEDPSIDAVSGASKTSRAIGLAIRKRLRLEQDLAAAEPLTWRWSDLWIGAVAILGLFAHRMGRLRVWFRWIAFITLAIVTGDLLALSLLAGWAEHGFPWRQAIGLVVLGAVAFGTPLLRGRSPYCADICPMGLAQSFATACARRIPHIPRWQPRPDTLAHWLPSLVPGLLLVTAGLALAWILPLDLADLEAFDAVSWPDASHIAIGLAIGGVLLSLVIPKAYCRFGCPTGALIELVRTPRNAARWRWRDTVAGVCLIAVWVMAPARSIVESWIARGPW